MFIARSNPLLLPVANINSMANNYAIYSPASPGTTLSCGAQSLKFLGITGFTVSDPNAESCNCDSGLVADRGPTKPCQLALGETDCYGAADRTEIHGDACNCNFPGDTTGCTLASFETDCGGDELGTDKGGTVSLTLKRRRAA